MVGSGGVGLSERSFFSAGWGDGMFMNLFGLNDEI